MSKASLFAVSMDPCRRPSVKDDSVSGDITGAERELADLQDSLLRASGQRGSKYDPKTLAWS